MTLEMFGKYISMCHSFSVNITCIAMPAIYNFNICHQEYVPWN